MENCEEKGPCLFINNYYTSPQLLIDLLEKNVYCAGTISQLGRTSLEILSYLEGETLVLFILQLPISSLPSGGEIAGMLMLSATCTTHHQHL